MVHTFRLNDCNIAVDGNSGSIHLLDNLSFDMLSIMEELIPVEKVVQQLKNKYATDEIIETYNELKILIEQKVLFTSINDLETRSAATNTASGIKSLCLHIAHDCNLRCEYCFAAKGDYKSGRKLMSSEVALAAVDYLVKNSGARHNIEIDFFGGEPLMNFETVKATVAYGRKIEKEFGKTFYFTITTNGMLLDDDNIQFINTNMDNVVISIDGRKEIHDAIRYDRSGKETYDRIVPLAKKLVQGRNGKSYFVRGTFTSRNMDFSQDVMHLVDLGFKEISVEPVSGSGGELFITEHDVPAILSEYEQFAIKYLQSLQDGIDFRFYHFNLDLYDGPCVQKRVAACGAGGDYLAVSPEGDLYPCHQFVGQNEFIMGNVFTGVSNDSIKNRFKATTILTKQDCRDCWAKLFCSGGCHANAWYTHQSIDKPNEIACTLQKKRIECATMVQLKKNNLT